MKIYVLDSKKIVAFAVKQVKGDESLNQGREIVSAIMAPRALIEHSGIYYLPTTTMEPEVAEKDKFTSNKDMVTIWLHPLFPDYTKDGQLSYSQIPTIKFVASIEEIIEQWSVPYPNLLSWFQEQDLTSRWTLFLT